MTVPNRGFGLGSSPGGRHRRGRDGIGLRPGSRLPVPVHVYPCRFMFTRADSCFW